MTSEHARQGSVEEGRRLEALGLYEILDTPAEGEFDEIVNLAARLCQAPISTITMVDAERQWFKAKVGLDISETPREIAFCAVTVEQGEPLVVPDARLDSRFADNPLVQGAPYLRFYAGFPLQSTDGYAIGTLSVMDVVPRTLTRDQMFAMEVLAHQVLARLELRRRLHQLQRAEAGMFQAKSGLEASVAESTRQLAQATAAHAKSERLYRMLWETTTDAVVIMDAHSTLHYVNPSTERMFGHPASRLVGASLAVLQPERLRNLHLQGLRRYIETGVKRVDWRAAEAAGLRADGSELPIEVAFSEFTMDGQRWFVGFIRDITERKRADAALLEEKERAQTTLRSIGDAVISTDRAGLVSFLNPMAERLTGWTHEEAYGIRHDAVLQLVHEATGAPISLLRRPASDGEEKLEVMLPTTVLRRRSGEALAIEGTVARIRTRPDSFSGWVIAFRDVSQSRQMVAQISYQASHDALTGLLNRAEFDRRLGEALKRAAAEQRPHSMLYLDLDQFKVVNDTCGHIAGDELLKQLSSLMALNLRGGDTLARLGGDEFGVLLDNCSAQAAVRVAEKLRQAVMDFTFAWEDRVFTTGVSIGHVHFEDQGLTLTEVLSKADEACYVAKDHGRNRIHTYQPGDEAQTRRHGEMEWIGLIHQALEEDRMVLYAQPIFAIADKSCQATHLEVLLRMRDRNGELIPPMAFIPAAERYNLMPMIDRWVIRAVCARIAEHMHRGVEIRDCYAVNLSGASLGDATLGGYIREQLTQAGIPATWICFEITETAAIANLSHAVQLIHEVKALGCRFALDDFGSGMSSFSYLKHLPVDFLKIDGSFVRDIVKDPVDRAMVASINEIGHLMGLQTIAEFVEDDAILQELRSIGVDYAQGYGLAKPAPFL